jgi:hypothetical protein
MGLRPAQGDEERLSTATTFPFVIPRSRLACGKLRVK